MRRYFTQVAIDYPPVAAEFPQNEIPYSILRDFLAVAFAAAYTRSN
jgi:hypothetical protein